MEHRDRVLIRHRDESDPDWWHRAMREMKKNEEIQFPPLVHWREDQEGEEEDPELTQADCLSSSRPDQHEEKAQLVDDKDRIMSTSSFVESMKESDTRGKQVGNDQDCTVLEDLRSQTATMKDSFPLTLQAIIVF
jgi:hypothetical protein